MKLTLPLKIAMLCAAMLGTPAAAADDFPSKAMKIVVPFPPGAATDILARKVAQKFSESFKQPVVVENRAGATGTIGSASVAKSPADGYTLLFATTSTHGISPNLYKNMPYDPVKDFEPISLVGWSPNVLVVHPSVPANSVKELVALAKANPQKYSFSSSGSGSSIHLAGEMFKSMAGVDMLHVPYKGATPAVTDLLGGQVQLMFDTVASSLPHIKAGKLRPLAVTTTKRSVALPSVPTMAEAGLPGYEMAGWLGLLAPKGTPKEIVDKLHGEVVKIVNMPDVVDSMTAQGIDLWGSTPREFLTVISKDVPMYAKLMKSAGMQPE